MVREAGIAMALDLLNRAAREAQVGLKLLDFELVHNECIEPPKTAANRSYIYQQVCNYCVMYQLDTW